MKRKTTEKGNKEKIRITSLPPSKWEDFKQLRLESLRKDSKAFLSSYEDEVSFGKDVWERRIRNVVFAVVDGKPVGMISFVQRNRKKNEHVADIFAVYVTKRYRGRGIGDKLLKRALSQIRKNAKVSKIALGVGAEQTSAVNLYLKNKFKVVGVLEREFNIDGNFYDKLEMERILGTSKNLRREQ